MIFKRQDGKEAYIQTKDALMLYITALILVWYEAIYNTLFCSTGTLHYNTTWLFSDAAVFSLYCNKFTLILTLFLRGFSWYI